MRVILYIMIIEFGRVDDADEIYLMLLKYSICMRAVYAKKAD